MNKSLLNKVKIIIVSTLVLLVVGMGLLCFLGFNNTVDYRESYQMRITAKDILEESTPVVKDACDNFFRDYDLAPVSYATEKLAGGETFVYKFEKDVSAYTADLKTIVAAALESEGITSEVEVTAYRMTPAFSNTTLWLLLSAGLILVAVFVYSIFLEKFAGAVSVIFNMVLSALLTVAMFAITRVPAHPFWIFSTLVSGIFAGVLSVGIVARFSEAVKNVGNDDKSFYEICYTQTKASVMRLVITLIGIAVASAVLLIVGNAYFKFLGIQLLISVLVAVLTSACWTGLVWAFVKSHSKDGKSRKTLVKE